MHNTGNMSTDSMANENNSVLYRPVRQLTVLKVVQVLFKKNPTNINKKSQTIYLKFSSFAEASTLLFALHLHTSY